MVARTERDLHNETRVRIGEAPPLQHQKSLAVLLCCASLHRSLSCSPFAAHEGTHGKGKPQYVQFLIKSIAVLL